MDALASLGPKPPHALTPRDALGRHFLHHVCARGDPALLLRALAALHLTAEEAEALLCAHDHAGHTPLDAAKGDLLAQAPQLLAGRAAAVGMVESLCGYLLPDVAAVVVAHACLFPHEGLAGMI